jgi:hypothetical protein
MSVKRDPYEGSHYLKADDLQAIGKPVTIEIVAIAETGTLSDARGKVIDRKVIAFKGTKKQLIVSPVNYRVIKANLGADESAWIGQRITLCVRYLDCFGELDVPCIRVWPNAPIPKSLRDKYGDEKPKH